MTLRARLLPAALADLTEIAAWIATEARSQLVALAFIARLRQRCDEIAALARWGCGGMIWRPISGPWLGGRM